jgi:CheY-like chemotaxis protein
MLAKTEILINQGQYQTQQLLTLLEDVTNKGASGILHVNASISPQKPSRNRVLIWQNGKIVYGGTAIPDNLAFAKKLLQQFKPDISESAIQFAQQKTSDRKSIRQLLEMLVKLRILNWEQIETFVCDRVVQTLEQILPYKGKLQFNSAVEFDLCFDRDRHGLDWSKLKLDLDRRKDEWATVAPTIPSMEAIPHLSKDGLNKVSVPNIRQHLQQWVDGIRSLVEIGEKIDKDPLQIARLYLPWVQAGAITFNNNPIVIEPKNLSTILSVDDSPIVQTTIKRALGDRYNLLLASNAVDALNLLNQKNVDLLLLDLTMPDIDGLDMCRTLRSIPKFRNLPIVMLTARDSLIDKFKGQLAGTNRYLTKPFDAEKLLEVVSEFVNIGNN